MSNDKFGTKFDRLYVAVVTPYKEDYEVDEPALRSLLQYFMQPKFVDAGGAIVINPEAGELFYLSRKEKRRNVEIAVEECGGKVPIFAGVFDLRTEDSVKVAIDAKDVGADGLFLMPPGGTIEVSSAWDSDKYPEVWIDMAKAQLQAADLPAITHPAAPYTLTFGPALPLDATLEMCRQIPNIIGWKMFQSYTGSRIIARALRALDRHVAILPALATLYHENLATGYFDGTVTGSFNYAMEPMIDHINAWKRNDLDEALRIWKSGLEDLHEYVYAELARLHVKYKIASWIRGLIPLPFMRPPVPKPKKEEILTIRGLLTNAGLSVIPEREFNRVIAGL
ncbi:MAG: dihydrodipicolinate synthase family protein [Deltaproteobacteria bacterium]|nr:MAG: dihydrodipicolinate synthase family protein [Deltaproteobacteria bacterium]